MSIAFAAVRIGLADHAAALHAAAGKERRVRQSAMVIAAGHGVEERRSAEFAGADDHRFVEQRFARRVLARHLLQIFEQRGHAFVEPGAADVVIARLAAVEDVAVVIPSGRRR